MAFSGHLLVTGIPHMRSCKLLVELTAGCLVRAIDYARAAREKGVSVAMLYDTSPAELRCRVARGMCRRAVYISADGNQTMILPDDQASAKEEQVHE